MKALLRELRFIALLFFSFAAPSLLFAQPALAPNIYVQFTEDTVDLDPLTGKLNIEASVVIQNTGAQQIDFSSIRFDIEYDRQYIQANSAKVLYAGNQWFGALSEINSHTQDNYQTNSYTAAYTAANNVHIQAQQVTELAAFSVIIIDDLLERDGNDIAYFPVRLNNITATDAAGNIVHFQGLVTGIYVRRPRIVSTQSASLDQQINLFPNPNTTGNLFVKADGANIQAYRLFDVQGRLLQEAQMLYTTQLELMLETLPRGNYHLEVHTDQGKITKPIIRF